MTPTTWVLAVLAVYRATLLVVADEITRRPRDWLLRRFGPGHTVSYLITCPWCSSIWLAPIVVGTGLYADPAPQPGWWWQLGAGSLTASAVAGFLARFASPE